MGKRAAKPQNQSQPGPDRAEPLPQTPLDADWGDALNYLGQLGAFGQSEHTWAVKVYQVGATGRGAKESFLYLFDCDLQDLPELEAGLARRYPGGGKFRVVVRCDGQIAKAASIEIAARPGYRADPKPWEAAPFAAAPQPEAPRGNSALENAIAQMVQFQVESQRQTQAMFERIEQRITQAPDPAAFLTNTMSMFRTFQEAMPKASNEGVLALLTQGIALGKEIGGGGGEPARRGLTGLFETLADSKLGEGIGAAIAAGMSQQQRPQHQQQPRNTIAPPPPVVRPGPVTPGPYRAPGMQQAQQQQPAATAAFSKQQIDEGMAFLLGEAQRGADPALVAEQIVDSIPPAFLDQLDASPDPVADLIKDYPLIGSHRAWFETLIENFFEPEEGADDVTEGHDGPFSAESIMQQPAS